MKRVRINWHKYKDTFINSQLLHHFITLWIIVKPVLNHKKVKMKAAYKLISYNIDKVH